MDAQGEYEDYDDLVRNAGWQRFCAYVEGLWGAPGTSNGDFFKNAVTNAATDRNNENATAKLREVLAAQIEIHRLMAHPATRVKELKPREAPAQEFVGSRRGSL